MILIVCLHALAAVLAPIFVRAMGRRAFMILATAPLCGFVWTLLHTPAVLAGDYPEVSYRWISSLGLDFSFRLDVLSWLIALIVGGVGCLILIYCSAYFGRNASGLGRFAGVFVAFAGVMFGLVTANNTLLIYIFWELTSVFSFLLIGHYHERQSSRRAAMQAITVTVVGGLCMLAGLVMMGVAPGGSFTLSDLVSAAIDGSLADGVSQRYLIVAMVLIVVGALTKSAQIPFHFWLPAAMAAPTPVSGYLHAAAMVKAGVYLIARLAPGFVSITSWRELVVGFGFATMIVGGYRALRQNDLKLVLAYGTVSQLGLIIGLVGYGTAATALAGLVMLAAHAMFKATLFLTVGTIDHQLGTRDLRELSGVGGVYPALALFAIIAVASMAGLPPFLGYLGKEAGLEAMLHDDAPVAFAAIVIGSIFTFAYSLRFVWGAFASKPGVESCVKKDIDYRLILPLGVLGIAGLVFGLAPQGVEAVFSNYASTFDGDVGHLALWNGVGLPLAATVLVIATGIFLFVKRSAVARIQSGVHVTSAEDGYRFVTTSINAVASRITAVVQRGSLPSYLSVMLMTMVWAVVGVMALVERPQFGSVRLWDSPLQAGIALIACVAAVFVVRARRRMKAVLLLAFVGYASSLLFALQGAPDLALTQAVVETVSLIVFVLVLRRLPPYFSNRPWASSRIRRASVGALVGITVALLGWLAASARIHLPVTVDYPEEVLSFGYGLNIVNVTLVDTRAWDTTGEISVLLAAATGVASLIFIRERTKRDHGTTLQSAIMSKAVWAIDPNPERAVAEHYVASGHLASRNLHPNQRRGRTLLPGSITLSPVRRSLVLEMGARLIFHPLIIFSIFLLLTGHNNPGGGFAGGVVAGIALAIRYLAGGRYELSLATRTRPGLVLASGMLIATTAAIFPVLLGGTILQTTVFDLDLPLIGHLHLASALFFDIGVYLIVLGLILDILTSLGSQIDRQSEAEGTSAPEVAYDNVSPLTEELAVPDDMRATDRVGRAER